MTLRRNTYGQSIGPALPDWTPVPLPPPVVLHGRFCRVEPLDLVHHAEALHDADRHDPDDRAWTYLAHQRPQDGSAFTRYVEQLILAPGFFQRAIITLPEEKAIGTAAYLRVDAANGVLEIGSLVFSTLLRRTSAATEALMLMIDNAIGTLGYRRVEWKCDTLNAPSRRAADRLGFRFEGVFRNAVVVKGRSRDTAWYALTAEDWQALRPGYQCWLDPYNHDANGQQRRTLRECLSEARPLGAGDERHISGGDA